MSDYIKKTYNKLVGDKLRGKYEYDRWFKTPGQRAGYEMTKKVIQMRVLSDLDKDIARVLELGPGPGTWTKLLLEVLLEANFDLVDISKEMLKVAREELANYKQAIDFIEADWLDYKTDKKYDLFFSCRALEYIENKEKAIKKVYDLLKPGGQGFIITKIPHYTRQKLLGSKIPKMHQGQISPRDLRKLFLDKGFKEIEIYPVVMNFYFSFFKSLWGNWFLFRLFYRFPLNFLSQHFSESYLVKFKKL